MQHHFGAVEAGDGFAISLAEEIFFIIGNVVDQMLCQGFIGAERF